MPFVETLVPCGQTSRATPAQTHSAKTLLSRGSMAACVTMPLMSWSGLSMCSCRAAGVSASLLLAMLVPDTWDRVCWEGGGAWE